MPYGNTRPVRIREHFDALPITAYYSDSSGLQLQLPATKWRHYGWMLDQINPKDNHTGLRPPGVCQHLKVDKLYVVDQLRYYWNNGNSSWTIVNWQDLDGLPSPTGSLDPNDPGYSNLVGSIMGTETYRNLCVSAFNKQITQVPAKISLLNFLFELKDFKELGKSLSKIPKALKDDSLARHVNLVTKHKKSLPKVVAKSGIDTFLSWNFQWAPFIGDLQTLSKVGENAYKRLDYLRQTQGKSVTVHYSKDDCYTHPQVGQVLFTQHVNSVAYRTYVLRAYECKFTSTWRLFQNLRDVNDALSGLKAVYATLGLNNPAKAVWNAIPFSFMLDWVGPFGSWLERAATQPFSGDWEISQVTSSVHEVYIIDKYVHNHGDGNNLDQIVESVQVDRYTRLDGLPFTLGAIDFSQLTDTQQKLALAIPLSKVLK